MPAKLDQQAARLKVSGKENYLTLGELARLVGRDRSRIRQLEQQGRLPAPIRARHGRHAVRLYSPAQVKVIVQHFEREGGRYTRRDRSSGNLTVEQQIEVCERRIAEGPKRDVPYYRRRARYLRGKLKKLTTAESDGKLSSNRRRRST